MAALDRPDVHAARRPRPARRLEHLADLAALGDRRSRGGTTGWSAPTRRTGSTSTSATSSPGAARRRTRSYARDAERSRTTTSVRAYLDDVAWTADEDPASIRWSFYRDFGDASHGVRLVAVDSRCSRHLEPDERGDGRRPRVGVGTRHTVGATPSDPPSAARLDAAVPARARAASPGGLGRGDLVRRVGQAGDRGSARRSGRAWIWSTGRRSGGRFDDVTTLLAELVSGEDRPASILMLSGDVHCSYLAEARLTAVRHPGTAIRQLTMSPFRNPVPRQHPGGRTTCSTPAG